MNFWSGGRSNENTRGRSAGRQGGRTDTSRTAVEIDLEVVAHRDTDSMPPENASGHTEIVHEHEDVKIEPPATP